MQLSIQLQNADRLLAAFKRAPQEGRQLFSEALERTAAFVVSSAAKAAPVGNYKGGGNLRQSIRYAQAGQASFRVIVNAEYGVYVDQGTRPHIILPRRKKMLAFQKDGRWIFAKQVNHPGTKANPFFSNAVRDAEPYANDELAKAADTLFKLF